MITVQGYVDDVAYAAQLDAAAPPAARAATRNGVVVACEPPTALAVLHANVGQLVSVTPTGPSYTLDLDDVTAALAGLYALTDVRVVEGADVPDFTNPDEVDPDTVVF